MSKANTRATINANIKQNGNQEITGQILNSVLNEMVDDYAEQEKLSELVNKVNGMTSLMPLLVQENLLSSQTSAQTAWSGFHDLGVTLEKGKTYKLQIKLTGFPSYRFGTLRLSNSNSSSSAAILDVTSLFGSVAEIVSGEWRTTLFVDTTSPAAFPYKYLWIRGASSAYDPDGQVEIKVIEVVNKAQDLVNVTADIVSRQYNSSSPTLLGYHVMAGRKYDLYVKARQAETAVGSSYGFWLKTDSGFSQVARITTAELTAGRSVSITPSADGDLALYQQIGTFTEPNVADVTITTNMPLSIYDKAVDYKIANFKRYSGKGCMYIGDSISTSDNYYWKGIITRMSGLQYALNITGGVGHDTDTDDANIWCADGGIKLIPPVTEANTIAHKSIWYRCANNRLSRYARFADYISLFGGTNDLATEGMVLGSVNDVPYVDNVASFPADKRSELTDVRPATLTYASALMGCIEMLHRDFPNAKILLPSVFPMLNSGNEVDASGLTLSERMAIVQMQVASKYNGEDTPPSRVTYPSCNYGVLAVPFYWDMRTKDNAVIGCFARDGVHPNTIQARRMAQLFLGTLETI